MTPARATGPAAARPCRHCGAEVVEGQWFDTLGEAHEAWVHAAGGLLCPRGGVAEPLPGKEVKA